MDDCGYLQGFMVRKHRVTLRRGGVDLRSVDRVSLVSSIVNLRALSIVSRYGVVRRVLNLVDSNPVLKARTVRGRIAVALYLTYRALGYSKSKSRILASRACRVSPRTLEKVERRNRDAIARLEVKVREVVAEISRKEGRLALP